MEPNGSLVVEHFVTPSPHGADELHCPYPVVSHQYTVYHPVALVPVDKLSRCGHLVGGRGEREGGKGGERKREGEEREGGGKGGEMEREGGEGGRGGREKETS